jgi:hypothetical protein
MCKTASIPIEAGQRAANRAQKDTRKLKYLPRQLMAAQKEKPRPYSQSGLQRWFRTGPWQNRPDIPVQENRYEKIKAGGRQLRRPIRPSWVGPVAAVA